MPVSVVVDSNSTREKSVEVEAAGKTRDDSHSDPAAKENTKGPVKRG